MKRVVIIIFLALGSFSFFAQNVHAQKVVRPRGGAVGSWRVLGTTHAKHSADHDAIIVAGPYDYFRKLKFKVTDAPLNLQRMIVRYDGGAPENIETRFEIPKGGESRIIDLRGGKRKLKSVEFWYDTKGFLNGQADVTLLGMK
ncbi:hypothetical protein [Pedobacter sp. MW01-1-1]|uniref:hypothetical protein n=1 Tax=Pedobacter sp. MW01-1-1 TaxID=3383027 RepID=UPI003FEEFFB6